MGLVIEGKYYAKSRDAGPYVQPLIPSEAYKENYDKIRWDSDDDQQEEK